MRLSFLYPPFHGVENQPNIKEVSDNYGIFPPLSLAQAAGIADSMKKHDIQFIDANALKLKKQEVMKKLKSFNPDIIFFTITTYLFYQALSWIEAVKKETGAMVVVGGVHNSMYPKETLMQKSIDIIIIGEAENTLPELLECLEKEIINKEIRERRQKEKKKHAKTKINKKGNNKHSKDREKSYKDKISIRDKKSISSLKNIKGIGFKGEKNRIILTEKREHLKDLDKAPFPARKYLPNHLYFSFISQRKNFTGIITSRGCPYRCIFCEQGTGSFRPRSPASIMKEIKECYYIHNIREFDIFDSSFTVDKKRVIDLCKLIISSNMNFEWSVRTRVDLVDKEMLRYMSKSGCKRIYYGIESGEPKVLENLRRETDLKKVKKIIDITKKNNIDSFGYFMIGSPGETEETIKKTISFAKSLNLDYAQFSKLSTLPATDLYDLWKEHFSYDYWKEFMIDPKKRKVMQRYNCSLDDEEISSWVKKAYREFYFRPSYILSSIFKIRSFKELKRKARAAIEMLF